MRIETFEWWRQTNGMFAFAQNQGEKKENQNLS